MNDLSLITGQKPVVCRAKKSVANFKLFLDTGGVVTLTVEGVAVDSSEVTNTREAYIKQLIFPEIEYDKIDKVRGMDINFITTAQTDEEAKELLTLLGAPFIK